MELTIKRGANGYRIGDSHHRAELTDHEVELARQLREGGMKLPELARKFGMSKSHMSRLVRFLRRQGGR
jgi:uncharacterized membrane protein